MVAQYLSFIIVIFLIHSNQSFSSDVSTSKKTVLVVGGAGYIGSYVNKLLHQRGYQTVVFDNLSTGEEASVKYGTLFKGDLTNICDLETIFSKLKIDAVLHFAAFIDVGESVQDPKKYYQNNLSNTLNLLNTMIKYNVKHFVFSSSASIFGIPQKDIIDENHPKNPISPYGKTKLMVEQILEDYEKAYDLKYISLRYFNAAGGDPESEIVIKRRNQSNLIPIALKSIMESDGKIQIFGNDFKTPDGTGVRDYIHIHDLATAHLLSLETLFQGENSNCYNLGIGKGFSVLEVIQAIEAVTKKKFEITISDRRDGDPDRLVADPYKAKEKLNWEPIYTDIEDIILDAFNVMFKN